MAALEQATLYLINHPDEAWKAFIAKHRDLDDELNRRAWRDTLPRLARRPAALDEGRYKRFANFLFKQGVITVALARCPITRCSCRCRMMTFQYYHHVF